MPLKKAFNRNGILIYPWYISDAVATKEIGRIAAGRKIAKVFLYIKSGMTHVFYDKESTDALGRWLLAKIIKDRRFYQLVIKKVYFYSRNLMNFCAGLEKINPAKMSDRRLLKIYSDYEKKLGILRIWGWVPVFLDGVFEPFFSDYVMSNFLAFLQKAGRTDKVADYYSLLSSSERMSEVQIESLDRLKLLLKIGKMKNGKSALAALYGNKSANFKEKYPLATALMGKHLDEFGWLTYAYTGPVMSFGYLFKTLRADLQNGKISAQIGKIKTHFRSLKKDKAKLKRGLKLPASFSYLFAVSAELMFIKDYRKGIYQKSYVAMDKIMSEFAIRLGITARAIRFLTRTEVSDALLKNKQPAYRAKAKQRVKVCCYTAANGRVIVNEGSAAAQLIAKAEKAEKKVVSRQTELKGSIAYSGLVRGRVKIILTKNDVPKLKIGDILVSSATNPDLISAMKKAAAFVTDTGGIICHAAIVARELKKPCVIGTKIATRILKDGDEVEVDANHGVVRILR
jgi:phosphohistidine swiveling domain-containing protein